MKQSLVIFHLIVFAVSSLFQINTCSAGALGMLLRGAGAVKDSYDKSQPDSVKIEKSLARWKSKASRGDNEAAYTLGNYYFSEKDFKESVKWFEMAAAQGDKKALAAMDKLSKR